MESFMLVRPFSDIHAEFWQPNKIPSILEMVVPPLPRDQETVALVGYKDVEINPQFDKQLIIEL
jgi:hypothetical protein